jgi:hypothetical protein
MPVDPEATPSTSPAESWEMSRGDEQFFSGAGRRMMRAMAAAAVAGIAIGWLARGWRWAAGFAIGAILSAMNFRSMKRAVAAISTLAAERTAFPAEGPPAPPPSGAGVAIRLMLRYALIGAVGYAIFKSSFVSLYAYFLGLFLFLAAIFAEAAYEIYCNFRHAPPSG